MSDETRELPYHNKQAWLHPGRLNFTQAQKITVSDHEKTCVHIDAQKQAMTQQTTAHKTVITLKEHTKKTLN